MPYDDYNVFAKIIKGQLPSKKIYEDAQVICFQDIAPTAPTHWLVVPKGKYVDFSDFVEKASTDEVANFFQNIGKIVNEHGLKAKGYRLITNSGKGAGQVVPHFHVHILAW